MHEEMKKLALFFLMVLVSLGVGAQGLCKISGKVLDSQSQQPLPGAMAMMIQGDEQPKGSTTDLDGLFSFNVKPGKYTFRVSFLGCGTYERSVEITADKNMGTIKIKPEDKQLKEVKAVGVMQRQEQKGDTTVFNAEAFKVNPDATTEDLIKKMPGMQVSGNSVSSGGEKVKKVLVDGKEYFGNDPMAALRNISADMVSKIEVYDRQSDQSQFTGFSDGNEERTINILTKMGITSGRFGRVYGGYGTSDRYEIGGNMNFFSGNHRVSVIGMLNNINQQNFSFSDFSDAMSNAGGMGMGMGFSAGNGGKNRTGSIGINYFVEKTDILKVEFSYMFKNNKNNSDSESINEYFRNNDDDSLHVNNSASMADSKTNEHSTSLRLTWTINKNNSIIFTPRLSWQASNSNSMKESTDLYDAKQFVYSLYDSYSDRDNVSGNGNIVWRHKFSKERRTLSLNFSGNVNNSETDQNSQNYNDYTYNAKRSIATHQESDNENKSLGLNANLMYTEPIGENLALQVNYSPSFTKRDGNKVVNADTVAIADYGSSSGWENMQFSPLLSNKKKSDYKQQKGGVGINFFRGRDINASGSIDVQQATLTSEQVYPHESNTHKTFTSVLPSFNMRYRKDRTLVINLRYRTSTSAPSVNQLQNVVDVSNTRRYSGGNENLSQSYSHSLNLFLMRNNPENSRGVFFRTSLMSTSDYITTSSIIATKDTVIDLGIVLPATVQYDKPVNVDGFWNINSNFTFSTPVQWLGSNVNFNVGASMRHTPSLYNGKKVKSDNYSFNGGVTIGSSFSENVDFTVSYDGGYSIRKSTMAAQSNYNNYSHTLSADLNCLFFTRLVVANSVSHQYTNGMDKGASSGGYDKNYISWNAAVACKFFSDRRGELRLKFNDILNNTSSVSRNILSTSVETSTTDVLRRYALLTFSYKFKPKGERKQNGFGFPEPPKGMRMGPPPGGGRPM